MRTSFLPLNLRKRWDFPPANANPSFCAFNPTLTQTPFCKQLLHLYYSCLSLKLLFILKISSYFVIFFSIWKEKKAPSTVQPTSQPSPYSTYSFPLFYSQAERNMLHSLSPIVPFLTSLQTLQHPQHSIEIAFYK